MRDEGVIVEKLAKTEKKEEEMTNKIISGSSNGVDLHAHKKLMKIRKGTI